MKLIDRLKPEYLAKLKANKVDYPHTCSITMNALQKKYYTELTVMEAMYISTDCGVRFGDFSIFNDIK